MKLNTGLWQQQTLKLSMTQELSQAIALLQYSVQELSAFLENKAIENPLLQIDNVNMKAIDPRMDRSRPNRGKFSRDQNNWIEQIGDSAVTMSEHLCSQLDFQSLLPLRKNIFEYIILSLDENGYLSASCQEIADRFHLPLMDAEHYLSVLQALEPAGIAARNLQECLLLQLKRPEHQHDLAELIISEHFMPFAEKKWKELARNIGVNLKEIQAVHDYIQTLNPRPGARFQQEKAAYITPDVVVDWDGHDFSVSVVDETIPKISFNHQYHKQLSAYQNQHVTRFLQDKFQDYQWIVKSLEQRKETLTNVTIKIVEKQPEFFKKGPDYLRPMTMKEIGEEIGVHESTVSRAVREKFAQTPFGTIELRTFFTSTIKTVSDEITSSSQVKKAIAKLVDGENKQRPFSDQEIVRLLKDGHGMVVSRRTVAKYREQLGIASSAKRKRYE